MKGVKCQFLKDNKRCLVAEMLVESKCECDTTRAACLQCLKADPPKSANRITAMIALSQFRRAKGMGEWTRLREKLGDLLSPLPAELTEAELASGAGSELHKMLAMIGLREQPGCACLARIREMNQKGEDWCEQNVDMIVGWLKEEAERRQMGWSIVHQAGAVRVVRMAIRRSRKKKAKQ